MKTIARKKSLKARPLLVAAAAAVSLTMAACDKHMGSGNLMPRPQDMLHVNTDILSSGNLMIPEDLSVPEDLSPRPDSGHDLSNH